jgi:hypothetical protein
MTRSARSVVYALTLAAGIAHAAEPPAALEFARIDAEFEAARERCDALAGQPKDVCLAEARADRRIRKAEVAARGQGTIKGWYDARIARAEAEFGVAKERCGVHAGADRESCVAGARQQEARVKDEARRARDEAEAKTGDGRGAAK